MNDYFSPPTVLVRDFRGRMLSPEPTPTYLSPELMTSFNALHHFQTSTDVSASFPKMGFPPMKV